MLKMTAAARSLPSVYLGASDPASEAFLWRETGGVRSPEEPELLPGFKSEVVSSTAVCSEPFSLSDGQSAEFWIRVAIMSDGCALCLDSLSNLPLFANWTQDEERQGQAKGMSSTFTVSSGSSDAPDLRRC